MKIKEIIAKKDAELNRELKVLSDKLLKTKFEVATKETNQHAEVKKVKTDIARIKTIIREREIQREEVSMGEEQNQNSGFPKKLNKSIGVKNEKKS